MMEWKFDGTARAINGPDQNKQLSTTERIEI